MFEGYGILIENNPNPREPTRDEAILHIVANLAQAALAEGARLAQVVGPEIAADLTVSATQDNARALAVLGVSTADIQAALEATR